MDALKCSAFVGTAFVRCAELPERVDAFSITASNHGVVLVTAGHRRVDIAHELVRRLVERIERSAPTHDMFAYGSPFFDQIVANPSDIDVLIAIFAGTHVTLASTPGLRALRLRAGRLDLATSCEPRLARVEHELSQGDTYLMCSEGVHTVLSEPAIGETLRDLEPGEAARSIVEAAQRGCPRSDATAIVVRPSCRASG